MKISGYHGTIALIVPTDELHLLPKKKLSVVELGDFIVFDESETHGALPSWSASAGRWYVQMSCRYRDDRRFGPIEIEFEPIVELPPIHERPFPGTFGIQQASEFDEEESIKNMVVARMESAEEAGLSLDDTVTLLKKSAPNDVRLAQVVSALSSLGYRWNSQLGFHRETDPEIYDEANR